MDIIALVVEDSRVDLLVHQNSFLPGCFFIGYMQGPGSSVEIADKEMNFWRES
jgi:hypothetical protein